MSKPLAVIVLPRVSRQIADADRWWRENRETSNAIADEIRRLLEHLVLNPYMGQAAENARRRGVGRWYLERIAPHLYSHVDVKRAQLKIVGFRHARRRPIRM